MKKGGKRTGEYIPCPLEECDKDHEILISGVNGQPYIDCKKWNQVVWLTRSSTAEKYLGAYKRISPEIGETPEEREEREFNE